MASERVQRRKPKRLTKKHIFPDEKIQEIRDAFHMFDKNGDGMITSDELGSVMISLGQRPSLHELKNFIKAVDTDRSGTIDFEEFVDIFARKVTMDPEAELRQVFKAFDGNHDGYIAPEELFNVMRQLGEKITLNSKQFIGPHQSRDLFKPAQITEVLDQFKIFSQFYFLSTFLSVMNSSLLYMYIFFFTITVCYVMLSDISSF
ncbi:unnamed protein product [Lymnaea stagnalis]|uniref:EF-hand domain-containing protein n=1 Tax=Lymnaea stagnalis TaxID=6523 RepID=A0AAV2HYF0_LYMST